MATERKEPIGAWRREVKPLVETVSVGALFEGDAMGAAISLDEIVTGLHDQGMSRANIVEHLTDQFTSGRGPLADMRKSMTADTSGLVSRVVSIDHAREMSGGDKKMIGTWITTGGRSVCPGCAALHGERMTEEEFESLHGTHECGALCYCFWLPGEVTAPEAAIKMQKLADEHPGWFHLDRPVEITKFKKAK